ncbi:MAG TPA: S8 family serine peptidase [Candidatus Eisenbacteria bacterium]|nr:S8 family serine peptidase [Candidatus Eisenbacteria bacterium]
MKRAFLALSLLMALTAAKPAAAATNQFLVQTNLGTSSMNLVCLLTGCKVSQSLPGAPSNFYVLNFSASANVSFLQGILQGIPGILNAIPVTNSQNPVGNRYIVRTSGGLLNLQVLCKLGLCSTIQSLDGAGNQLFLLAGSSSQNPNIVLNLLRALPGVLAAELDQVVSIATGSAASNTPPPSLVDTTPVSFYSSTVWNGYVNQPATQVIRVLDARNGFNVTGSGVIADIDTGVDPNHPVLVPVLLPGYDFTRNQPGASEMIDLPSGSTAPESPCVNCTPGNVNQHSIAMVDQHSIAMVDQPGYEDFGHGTMVAGILHLVAPTASILPLKAFGPDGTGSLSNILRAIYYASSAKATVVNMSFDLSSPSQELAKAIDSAEANGVLFVASVGNDGKMELVYPAGLSNVMGVASTNDRDERSDFSNYGNQIVWVAAPGEAIVTTYPFGSYAAGWGTSFSAPMVSGTVDLIRQANPGASELQAAWAIAQAQFLLDFGMGNGRIDMYNALASVQH